MATTSGFPALAAESAWLYIDSGKVYRLERPAAQVPGMVGWIDIGRQ